MTKKIFLPLVFILFLSNFVLAQNKMNHITKLVYWGPLFTHYNHGAGLSYAIPLKKQRMTLGVWAGTMSGGDFVGEQGRYTRWQISPEIQYYINELLNEWFVYTSYDVGQLRPTEYSMRFFDKVVPTQARQSYSAATLGVGYDYKMSVSFIGARLGLQYFFEEGRNLQLNSNLYIGFYF